MRRPMMSTSIKDALRM
uniref:Uncharacterized protein n=1 Tax=Anguilla anguilla TaxID=7936 RepID=A0A0E9T5X9_ANGAN